MIGKEGKSLQPAPFDAAVDRQVTSRLKEVETKVTTKIMALHDQLLLQTDAILVDRSVTAAAHHDTEYNRSENPESPDVITYRWSHQTKADSDNPEFPTSYKLTIKQADCVHCLPFISCSISLDPYSGKLQSLRFKAHYYGQQDYNNLIGKNSPVGSPKVEDYLHNYSPFPSEEKDQSSGEHEFEIERDDSGRVRLKIKHQYFKGSRGTTSILTYDPEKNAYQRSFPSQFDQDSYIRALSLGKRTGLSQELIIPTEAVMHLIEGLLEIVDHAMPAEDSQLIPVIMPDADNPKKPSPESKLIPALLRRLKPPKPKKF